MFKTVLVSFLLVFLVVSAQAQSYPYSNYGEYSVTTTEIDGGSDGFLVYHPSNLDEITEAPLLTWSNPTWFDSWSFNKLCRLPASYGMIVVASHSVQTGSGEDAIDGINAMLELNSDPASMFFGTISEDAIGAYGHSQGGQGTVNAVFDDPRIKCTAPLHPGIANGYPASVADNGAMLIITGQYDPFSTPAFCEGTVYNKQAGPTIFAVRRNASHYAPVSALGGDSAYEHYATVFFLRHLAGRSDLQSEIDKIKSDRVFSSVKIK